VPTPVTFPPGRRRLATRASRVARSHEQDGNGRSYRFGRKRRHRAAARDNDGNARRTSSAANCGRLSSCPPLHRNSIADAAAFDIALFIQAAVEGG
jgi:hypothetical protein